MATGVGEPTATETFRLAAYDNREVEEKRPQEQLTVRLGALERKATGDGSPTVAQETAEISYLIWTPEIAREMTRRWISEVPSKIV